MASQKVGYKNSEVKSRIFEKASSSIIDSGKAAQSIVKNSRNKDILHQVTKTFVGLDSSIGNLDQNIGYIDKALKRMELQYKILEESLQSIQRMTRNLHEI